CAKIWEVIRTEAGPDRARPHTLERQAFPMAKEFFGTDGIRGVPGTPPLDDATLYATGRSLGAYLKRDHGAAHVLIGVDTRESGGLQARPGIVSLARSRRRGHGRFTRRPQH